MCQGPGVPAEGAGQQGQTRLSEHLQHHVQNGRPHALWSYRVGQEQCFLQGPQGNNRAVADVYVCMYGTVWSSRAIADPIEGLEYSKWVVFASR